LKETLKIATLVLVIGLIALSLFSPAWSQQPPLPPVVIEGYVTIQTISGTNMTAPAGLTVYTKQQNTTIPNNPGSTLTNAQGFYIISVGNANNTVPPEGSQIDIWVQGINVTRITFSYHANPVRLNLTVVETTAPTIQVLSPLPGAYVSSSLPVWVNATLTDNLAIDPTSITMTLNQAPLAPTFNSTTGLLSNQTGPLTPGLYIANITVSNIAGNTTSEAWNFTSTLGVPPTISITSPTTANPAYAQSGKPVQVVFTYTEPSPLNWTIMISNNTYTNTTAITPGTATATANVIIPLATPQGTYDLAVTMYNNYSLSATATQLGAVVIDNTPPTVAITYPTQGAYVTTSQVWVNGTVTDTNMAVLGNLQPATNDSRFTLPVWVSATGAFAFTGTLPYGAASVNVTFTDLAGNIGSSTVTFTVDTGPQISTPYQNPPGQFASSSVTLQVANETDVTVSANITDVSGVASATLFYNNGSGWVNETMTLSTGNLYTATIPGQPLGTSVTYYITATNSLNSTTRSPGDQLYYPITVVPEFGSFVMLLLILAIATTLATVTSRTTKRKSPPLK